MSEPGSYRFAEVRPIGAGQVRWTGGFAAHLHRVCRDSMVPAMGRLMTQTERARYAGNFEVAAGLAEGRHRGPKWNDGDFYKWLEAAAAVYGATRDAALGRQLDELIDLVARAQDPDGYLHTDVQIAGRAAEGQPAAGPVKPRFGDPMDFEMYNHGHLITAGCVHFSATGKRALLDVAVKAADFLDRHFAHPTPDQARHGICPAHLMALPDLYRLTGEKRYLDLAMRLLDMRDLVSRGDDDNQDRIPFRRQTTAHGHAVRATYLYSGAADLFLETGDASLLDPLKAIWTDLVGTKLAITGGCGALYDGASPDGASDQATITRVHQAFGRAYQLPHSTAHNETCAAIGNLLFNWRLFLISGEAKYVDLVEQTFYNSVLAGVSLDGTAFFYTNTLRQLDPMPCELRWPRHRAAFMSCFCCPPNVVRTVARLNEYAYALGDGGVFVTLYGAGRVEAAVGGNEVVLSQQTDYPWDGRITITVERPAGEWTLFLRLPGWADGAAARVNGAPAGGTVDRGFLALRRPWRAGDVVTLDLQMPVRLIEANPYVEEARNHAAVMRGPIVYCMESTDLPAGVRVLDVGLSRRASFEPAAGEGMLSPVRVLRGAALARAGRNWSGRLYQPLSTEPPAEIPITLVPYFAWDNRGPGEMTVWLPLFD